jgi:MFS family permease
MTAALNGYRAIFDNRSFRLFWFGFAFSVFGDAVSRVALTWFVYEHTKSARALGWLMFWYTGPVIVGGLAAGWLLDRFDRRRMIAIDNIVRGLTLAAIPILHAAGQLALWHIYLVAAVYGLLMMISLAGGPALIPSIVDRNQLATANALETLGFTLGGVAGPVLAGWLIAALGPAPAILLDVLSYFAFAAAVARVQLRADEAAGTAGPQTTCRTKDALALLWTRPVLLSTTIMFTTFNIGMGVLMAWLPILSDQTLRGGSALYGTLMGVWALGEVISAVLVGSWRPGLPLGTRICLAQILAGASLALVLVGPTQWTVGTGLFLLGIFSAPLTIWVQTLRMRVIPERLRGRTFALLRMLIQSGSPIGGALAGALTPAFGLPAMIVLSALRVGVPGATGYQVRALRAAGEEAPPAPVESAIQ